MFYVAFLTEVDYRKVNGKRGSKEFMKHKDVCGIVVVAEVGCISMHNTAQLFIILSLNAFISKGAF